MPVDETINMSSQSSSLTLDHAFTYGNGNTAYFFNKMIVTSTADFVRPVITMKQNYLTVKKGSSPINLLDQVQSVIDDVDGELDINDIQLTTYDELGEEVLVSNIFTPDTVAGYLVHYRIKDAQGNEGFARIDIAVYDAKYSTTVTNNKLPMLKLNTEGLPVSHSMLAYLVPEKTSFSPANPGTIKPRFIMPTSTSVDWVVVTDQQQALDAVYETPINVQLQNLANNLKLYIIPEATFSENPTIDEIAAYCSDERLQSTLTVVTEAECLESLQQMYEQEIIPQAEQALADFDAIIDNYDWTPLADGTYDIYFYEPNMPANASFPSGLIIDTTKPEATVALPSKFLADDIQSPSINGTVDDPNATIIVTINGKSYTARNNGDGTWTLAAGTIDQLDVGEYEVLVAITDQAGNETTTTTQLTVIQAATSPTDSEQPTTPDTTNPGNSTAPSEEPKRATELAETGQNSLVFVAIAVLLAILGLITRRYMKNRV